MLNVIVMTRTFILKYVFHVGYLASVYICKWSVKLIPDIVILAFLKSRISARIDCVNCIRQ